MSDSVQPHPPGGLDREAVARVIDPDAYKTKAEWYAYLGPRMADQVFARLQSDTTVEQMNPRRREALAKADQILALPNPRAEALEAEVERLKEECRTRKVGQDYSRQVAESAEAALKVAVGALEGPLAELDRADAECPVNNPPSCPERCPKCYATSSQNCGPNVRALDALAQAARQALSALQGGGNGK